MSGEVESDRAEIELQQPPDEPSPAGEITALLVDEDSPAVARCTVALAAEDEVLGDLNLDRR